jgi:hypothetical protein
MQSENIKCVITIKGLFNFKLLVTMFDFQTWIQDSGKVWFQHWEDYQRIVQEQLGDSIDNSKDILSEKRAG